MKKQLISIMVLLNITLMIAVIAPRTIHAQSQEQLMVAVTPYQQLQKLDFFFSHSVYSLGYYDGNTSQPSVFLSIITPEQKEEYSNAGYKPIIIDENAGAITQYYELTNNREVNQSGLLIDPAYKQQGLELVYPLSNHKVLIKLAKNIEYSQLQIPGLKNFRELQFANSIDRPNEQIRENLRQQLSLAPIETNNNGNNSQKWLIAFVLLLLILSVACYTLFIKKHTYNDIEPH